MCGQAKLLNLKPSSSSNNFNASSISSALTDIGTSVNGFVDKVAARIKRSEPVRNVQTLLTDSITASASSPELGVWICPQCTYGQNPFWARSCDVCGFDPAFGSQLGPPQLIPLPSAPPIPNTVRPDNLPGVAAADDAALPSSSNSNATNFQANKKKSKQKATNSPVLESNSFVIEDYDTHLHNALAEWQAIVAAHEPDSQFNDASYQPGLDAILYDASKPISQSELFDSAQGNNSLDVRRIHWQRPYHVARFDRAADTPWTVFRSPMPSDIHQGVLGNCWLVSALSLIACEPLLLHKIFITPDFQRTGAYSLRLCVDGCWRVIIIDDLLPCYGSSTRLLFSKATRNQLWVPLIEKALAKSYGCYEALAGGHTYEGLSALTGEAVETLVMPIDEHPDPNRQERSSRRSLDPEDIWIKLVSYLEARFLIGASCGREATSENVYNSIGLIKNHAYAVLAVHSSINTVDGKPLRLVKLRNPWGTSDWNGDWCDASPLWRTNCPPDVKNQLAPYGQPEGVCWMSYRDFLFYFENLDICKVRPDWREYRVTAPFVKNSSESAVVVLLTVVETTQIELMLHQHGLRQKSKVNRSPVDLFMVLVSVRRIGSQLIPGKIMGSSGNRRLDSFAQAGEFLVQPGEYAVVVMTCHGVCMTEYSNRTYTLSIHSAKPVVVDPISLPRSFIVDSLTLYVRTFGKKYYGPGDIIVSYITEGFSGLALLVDNGSSNWQVKIECDCSGSENVVSSRATLSSIDYLPPRSSQLLQMLTPLEPRERWHVVHHLKHVASTVQYEGGFLGLGGSPVMMASTPAITENIQWLHGVRPFAK